MIDPLSCRVFGIVRAMCSAQSLKVCCFISILAQFSGPSALAQQGHYEFVPGSRQARWVPGPAPQAGTQAVPGAGVGRAATYGQPTSYGQPANSTQGRGRRGFIIDEATGQMYTGTSVGGYPPQYARPLPASNYQGRGAASPVYPGRAGGGVTASSSSSSSSGAVNATAQRGAASKTRDYMDSVVVDGVARTFMVHLPSGYNGTRPLPVVMAFHGLGMNSTMMFGLTGFTGLADRKNFIVVFPNSAGGRFQDGLAQGPDDVSFVRAMLDKMQRGLSIDSKRIYACGISNGGYFTQLLALAMPDRIAACGVVASTLTAGAKAIASGGRAVPIVFFEGVDDPLLPWGDGRSKELGKLGEALGISALGSIDSPLAKMGGLSTVPETIDFWTSNNRAPTSAQVSTLPDSAPGDGTRVEMHNYGSGANQVLLYRIIGGGHTWPGSLNIKAVSGISGNISQDIDATELLWDFFSRHSS